MRDRRTTQELQADFLAACHRFAAEKAEDGRDWCFAVRPLDDTGPWRIVEVGVATAAADLVTYSTRRGQEVRPATPLEIAGYHRAGNTGGKR